MQQASESPEGLLKQSFRLGRGGEDAERQLAFLAGDAAPAAAGPVSGLQGASAGLEASAVVMVLWGGLGRSDTDCWPGSALPQPWEAPERVLCQTPPGGPVARVTSVLSHQDQAQAVISPTSWRPQRAMHGECYPDALMFGEPVPSILTASQSYLPPPRAVHCSSRDSEQMVSTC